MCPNFAEGGRGSDSPQQEGRPCRHKIRVGSLAEKTRCHNIRSSASILFKLNGGTLHLCFLFCFTVSGKILTTANHLIMCLWSSTAPDSTAVWHNMKGGRGASRLLFDAGFASTARKIAVATVARLRQHDRDPQSPHRRASGRREVTGLQLWEPRFANWWSRGAVKTWRFKQCV